MAEDWRNRDTNELFHSTEDGSPSVVFEIRMRNNTAQLSESRTTALKKLAADWICAETGKDSPGLATLENTADVSEKPTVQKGSKKKKLVKEIQKLLNDKGITDNDGNPLETSTGIFGAKTKQAVEKLQTQNNIKANGKVGQDTWKILYNIPLVSEDTGAPIENLYDLVEISEVFVNPRPTIDENTLLVKLHIPDEEYRKLPETDSEGRKILFASKFVLGDLSDNDTGAQWAAHYFEDTRFLRFNNYQDFDEKMELLKGVLYAFEKDHEKSKFEFYESTSATFNPSKSEKINLKLEAEEIDEFRHQIASNLYYNQLASSMRTVKYKAYEGGPERSYKTGIAYSKPEKHKIVFKLEPVRNELTERVTAFDLYSIGPPSVDAGGDLYVPPVILTRKAFKIFKKMDDWFDQLRDKNLEPDMSTKIKEELGDLQTSLYLELMHDPNEPTTEVPRGISSTPELAGVMAKGFSKSLRYEGNRLEELKEADIVGDEWDYLVDAGDGLLTGFLGGFESRIAPLAGPSRRTINLIANVDVILGIPGIREKAEKHCSFSIPSANIPKPSKEYPKPYKLKNFMKDFVYVEPLSDTLPPGALEFARPQLKLKPKTVDGSTDEEIVKEVDRLAKLDQYSKPESPEEKSAKNRILKDPRVKNALARKKRNISDQIADELVRQRFLKPEAPKKIKTLQDAFDYTLNKMDFPTLARKALECLRLNISIQDIIEYMCDELLKTVLSDPDSAVKALTKIERFQMRAPAIVPGASDTGAVLVSGTEILSVLKQQLGGHLGGKTTAATGDEFYGNLIAGLGSGPSAAEKKIFLCKLIVAGGIAAGEGIVSLIDQLQTGDSSLGEAFFGKDKRPQITKCDPNIKIPEKFPFKEKLLARIKAELNEQIKSAIENLIVTPLQELILTIIEACKAYPEGPASTDDLGTTSGALTANLPQIPQPTAGTSMDLSGYFDDLFARLTRQELCSLLDGTPSKNTIQKVQNFNKIHWPPIHKAMPTKIKIKAMFERVASNTSVGFCAERQVFRPIADLCVDGEARKAARRASLAGLGLNDADVEKQMKLDDDMNRDTVGSIIKSSLGTGQDSVEDQIAQSIASSLANDPELQKMNMKLLENTFGTTESVLNNNLQLLYESFFSFYENVHLGSNPTPQDLATYYGDPKTKARDIQNSLMEDNLTISEGAVSDFWLDDSLSPWKLEKDDILTYLEHAPAVETNGARNIYIGTTQPPVGQDSPGPEELKSYYAARDTFIDKIFKLKIKDELLNMPALSHEEAQAQQSWQSLLLPFVKQIYMRIYETLLYRTLDRVGKSSLYEVLPFLGKKYSSKVHLNLSNAKKVIDIQKIKEETLQQISTFTAATDLQSDQLTALGDAVVVKYIELIVKLLIMEYIVKAGPYATSYNVEDVLTHGPKERSPIVEELKSITFKRRDGTRNNLYEVIDELQSNLSGKYGESEVSFEKIIEGAVQGMTETITALTGLKLKVPFYSCACPEVEGEVVCHSGPTFPIDHWGSTGFPVVEVISNSNIEEPTQVASNIFADLGVGILDWREVEELTGIDPHAQGLQEITYYHYIGNAKVNPTLPTKDPGLVSRGSMVLETYVKFKWNRNPHMLGQWGDDPAKVTGINDYDVVSVNDFIAALQQAGGGGTGMKLGMFRESSSKYRYTDDFKIGVRLSSILPEDTIISNPDDPLTPIHKFRANKLFGSAETADAWQSNFKAHKAGRFVDNTEGIGKTLFLMPLASSELSINELFPDLTSEQAAGPGYPGLGSISGEQLKPTPPPPEQPFSEDELNDLIQALKWLAKLMLDNMEPGSKINENGEPTDRVKHIKQFKPGWLAQLWGTKFKFGIKDVPENPYYNNLTKKFLRKEVAYPAYVGTDLPVPADEKLILGQKAALAIKGQKGYPLPPPGGSSPNGWQGAKFMHYGNTPIPFASAIKAGWVKYNEDAREALTAWFNEWVEPKLKAFKGAYGEFDVDLADMTVEEVIDAITEKPPPPTEGSKIYRDLFCSLKESDDFKNLFYGDGEEQTPAMPIYDILQSLIKASTTRFDMGFKELYPKSGTSARTQIEFENGKVSIFEPVLEYLISMLVFTLDNRGGGYD